MGSALAERVGAIAQQGQGQQRDRPEGREFPAAAFVHEEEAGGEVPVAVRSSAAGEDSRKKAFAGLQDTYLNMCGKEQVALAYHWDCASAYNLRSMTYRREAILDAIALAEETGDESIA